MLCKMGQTNYSQIRGWIRPSKPTLLNQSLVLKNIWKLASEHDALWVKIMAAKYYPVSTFWHSHQLHACTVPWRAMLQNRDMVAANLRWLIGDCQTCVAYAQPWFADWRGTGTH